MNNIRFQNVLTSSFLSCPLNFKADIPKLYPTIATSKVIRQSIDQSSVINPIGILKFKQLKYDRTTDTTTDLFYSVVPIDNSDILHFE